MVLKLFHIVSPDVTCFGQKDFQQALVIRHMVGDLNLGVRLIICPIVRDPDGLAKSSRHAYMSPEDRQTALYSTAASVGPRNSSRRDKPRHRVCWKKCEGLRRRTAGPP